jgi:hypothetical protein
MTNNSDKKILTLDNLQRYHSKVSSKFDEKLDKTGN